MLQGFKDLKSTKPEVCVKMKNLENGTEFIWPKEKFLNRLYLMKEMYNNYEVVAQHSSRILITKLFIFPGGGRGLGCS